MIIISKCNDVIPIYMSGLSMFQTHGIKLAIHCIVISSGIFTTSRYNRQAIACYVRWNLWKITSWKRFLHCGPPVRGLQRAALDFVHKAPITQWIFCLNMKNCLTNSPIAGDLTLMRHSRKHDVHGKFCKVQTIQYSNSVGFGINV